MKKTCGFTTAGTEDNTEGTVFNITTEATVGTEDFLKCTEDNTAGTDP
jgi:hypothetical protein